MKMVISQQPLDSVYEGKYALSWEHEGKVVSMRAATEQEVLLWWILNQLEDTNTRLSAIDRNTF